MSVARHTAGEAGGVIGQQGWAGEETARGEGQEKSSGRQAKSWRHQKSVIARCDFYSRGGNDRPDFIQAPDPFLFTFGAGQTRNDN